jgi:hypothetical protein
MVTVGAALCLALLLPSTAAFADTGTGSNVVFDYTDTQRHCGFGQDDTSSGAAQFYSSSQMHTYNQASCTHPESYGNGSFGAYVESLYWDGSAWQFCSSPGWVGNVGNAAFVDQWNLASNGSLCAEPAYFAAVGFYFIGSYYTSPNYPLWTSPWNLVS